MAFETIDPTKSEKENLATTIETLRTTLISETAPLSARTRALYSLKHLASLPSSNSQSTPSTNLAISAISSAFKSPSALLKHELAYCLGQTRNLDAASVLREILGDLGEDVMVRHEAAEALGALGDRGSLELLRRYRDLVGEERCVRETCELAVGRIEWEEEGANVERLKRSDFASIDPAPPMAQVENGRQSIEQLEKDLLDTSKNLFLRYRAMFTLRDLASPPDLPTAMPAIQALAKALHDPSALLRHEIAFVFGQLSHPASIPALRECLSNLKEASMVRHEAAEALGSLGDEEGVEEFLKTFLGDEEQVVRDSVVIALDMAEFEKSGAAEYALIPEKEVAVAAA